VKQFTVVFDNVGLCPVWIDGGCNHPKSVNGTCYGVGSDPVPPHCPCKDLPPYALESTEKADNSQR